MTHTGEAVERVRNRVQSIKGGHGFITISVSDANALLSVLPSTDALREARKALETARAIIAAMSISGMVGRVIGENKIRSYDEARRIFVSWLAAIDAALAKLDDGKETGE